MTTSLVLCRRWGRRTSTLMSIYFSLTRQSIQWQRWRRLRVPSRSSVTISSRTHMLISLQSLIMRMPYSMS